MDLYERKMTEVKAVCDQRPARYLSQTVILEQGARASHAYG